MRAFPALQSRNWRHNFTGVRVGHAPTGLALSGAIDNLWADAERAHRLVDLKATSKGGEVTLDANWQGGYRRRVEFSQWLPLGAD